MTYEGARAVTGPFLGSLGARATIVRFVAGFGELIGYSLRSVSGYLADESSKYWIVTFVGYLINMLAVPALALAGNWPLAAALIVAERADRAIRRPAVEAMLSYAGKSIGRCHLQLNRSAARGWFSSGCTIKCKKVLQLNRTLCI